MNHIHWVRDLPAWGWEEIGGEFHLTQEIFDNIADYTQSMPTGPSPGRIYKKNLHWSGPPSNWHIYVCWRDKEYPDAVSHTPLRAVIIDK